MVFSPYMPTTGGGGGQCSTLLIHRSNTKHTNSSAQVKIDGKSPENALGQICTQHGSTDHIDPGRSTPVRKREDGCLCFFVCHTNFLVFGVAENHIKLN
jgi:hypothetical protein